jgi:TRAP-type mannitol/chloroaromatic compound transport system permease small subunit
MVREPQSSLPPAGVLGAFVRGIDRLNEVVGRAASWLFLAMALATLCVVILRYVFSVGFIWLQESYVWLNGIAFMVGAGYTLLKDGHVRVDIFYRPASWRFRAWVDLVGSLLLLLPMVVVVLVYSVPYVAAAWEQLESSREASGLPAVFLLKSVLLLFCLLLGLQGLALAGRSLLALLGRQP